MFKKYGFLVLVLSGLLLTGASCFTKTVTVNSNANTNSNGANANAVAQLHVTLYLDYGNASPVRTFTKDVEAGTTALQLLQTVANEQNIAVTTKEFSFGTQITGIGGLEQTSDTSWTFYVNGAEASVGAGAYTLVNNDTIKFKFQKGA